MKVDKLLVFDYKDVYIRLIIVTSMFVDTIAIQGKKIYEEALKISYSFR